ncbi:hypothetical protein SNN83_001522 [Cronobacter malonaticus]|nr:hypothetical protein [Cronobacter malonaticus]
MSVEVTTKDLNDVLLDSEVQALIVSKLSQKKTEGLADALTAQLKSLGVITDASSANGDTNESGTNSETEDAEAQPEEAVEKTSESTPE